MWFKNISQLNRHIKQICDRKQLVCHTLFEICIEYNGNTLAQNNIQIFGWPSIDTQFITMLMVMNEFWLGHLLFDIQTTVSPSKTFIICNLVWNQLWQLYQIKIIFWPFCMLIFEIYYCIHKILYCWFVIICFVTACYW